MITRGVFRVLIALLFTFSARRRINTLFRWLRREHKAPRKPLATLRSVDEVADHVAGYDWRRDGLLDYVSAPEVTEARLAVVDDPAGDGDCDDLHHLACVYLKRLLVIRDAVHVSIGYKGGGHICAAYQTQVGVWYLMNYGAHVELGRGELADHRDAIERELLRWASRGGKREVGSRARWLFAETTEFQRVPL